MVFTIPVLLIYKMKFNQNKHWPKVKSYAYFPEEKTSEMHMSNATLSRILNLNELLTPKLH